MPLRACLYPCAWTKSLGLLLANAGLPKEDMEVYAVPLLTIRSLVEESTGTLSPWTSMASVIWWFQNWFLPDTTGLHLLRLTNLGARTTAGEHQVGEGCSNPILSRNRGAFKEHGRTGCRSQKCHNLVPSGDFASFCFLSWLHNGYRLPLGQKPMLSQVDGWKIQLALVSLTFLLKKYESCLPSSNLDKFSRS